MAHDPVVQEVERWFLARGLPHFISDYTASRDIWTRALPALTLLFLVEVAINAPSREFPLWLDVVVVVAAFGALAGAWAIVNRARGRRPFARPDDLGPFEVAFFVVVPALVPLAAGVQVGSALATAAVNVAVLGAIYLSTSYGIVPLSRWALVRVLCELGAMLNLLVRALPLLLLFVTFLFVNTEVWQVAATLRWSALAVVVGLFAAVGLAFAAIRLPRQVGEVAAPESRDVLHARVRGTPAERLLAAGEAAAVPVPAPAPLTRRQWGNVGLVVLASEGIQIALVAVLVFAFFVVFGTLAIGAGVIESWVGADPNRYATLDVLGQELVLTEELVHVAAFLAGFSGLYFTVVLLTDATYRDEFLEEILGEVRQSLAVRAVYLAFVSRPGATMPST